MTSLSSPWESLPIRKWSFICGMVLMRNGILVRRQSIWCPIPCFPACICFSLTSMDSTQTNTTFVNVLGRWYSPNRHQGRLLLLGPFTVCPEGFTSSSAAQTCLYPPECSTQHTCKHTGITPHPPTWMCLKKKLKWMRDLPPSCLLNPDVENPWIPMFVSTEIRASLVPSVLPSAPLWSS